MNGAEIRTGFLTSVHLAHPDYVLSLRRKGRGVQSILSAGQGVLINNSCCEGGVLGVTQTETQGKLAGENSSLCQIWNKLPVGLAGSSFFTSEQFLEAD
jgi:hypothetical protein